MKYVHGWARLMLTPPGVEEGRGFEEGHFFFSYMTLPPKNGMTPKLPSEVAQCL